MNPSRLLRPVHAWFFLWERTVPSLYRVVATGLGALASAVVLTAVGLHPLLAVSLALLVWIALAIAQERDERVLGAPDDEFVTALADTLGEPPLSLTVVIAHGPRRARLEPGDMTVVLESPDSRGPLGTMFVTIDRSSGEGWMRVDVVDDAPGVVESIHERLIERSQSALAERIQRSESPRSDASAVRAALLAAYG